MQIVTPDGEGISIFHHNIALILKWHNFPGGNKQVH